MSVGSVVWSLCGVVALVVAGWSLAEQDWLEVVSMAILLAVAARGVFIVRRRRLDIEALRAGPAE